MRLKQREDIYLKKFNFRNIHVYSLTLPKCSCCAKYKICSKLYIMFLRQNHKVKQIFLDPFLIVRSEL